jgi:hypothetical protein
VVVGWDLAGSGGDEQQATFDVKHWVSSGNPALPPWGVTVA